MASLQERVSQGIKNGAVSLSSDDIAAESQPKKGEKVMGTVKTTVDKADVTDTVTGMAANGDLNSKLTQPQDEPAMEPIDVEITDMDREMFLDAMINGTRFELPFSLFGNKVTGMMRIRSQAESQALLSRLMYELRTEKIQFEVEYSSRLRSMLLAAQIRTLNGVDYAELSKPYVTTVHSADKVEEPGWLEQVVTWERMPEGMVTAMYDALREFEAKYWTMIRNAKDQNFWKPAKSI